MLVNTKSTIAPFVQVKGETMTALIQILKERLPHSSSMYNMAKTMENFPTEMAFYTLYADITPSSSWIVSTFYREDTGLDISISAPAEAPVTEEIKNAFSTSKLIDWNKPYIFVALEKRISTFIFDISANIKGNAMHVYPCILYCMSPEDCLQLDTSHKSGVELKPLDTTMGLEFILNTWKYKSEGSDISIKKILERNVSAGIYIDEKPVCGIATIGSGILSMLYTSEEHRGKGYGKVCLHSALKELAKKGLAPCLTVETRNETSKAFQLKCGLKVVADVDWVKYTASGF